MNISQISKDDITLIEDLWYELKQHHQEHTSYYRDYYQTSNFAKRKTELLKKDSLAIYVAHHENKLNQANYYRLLRGIDQQYPW